MKIKPPTTNPDPKELLRQRFLRAADRRLTAVCHSFQAWIQAASLPDRRDEVRLTGTVQPALPEAALEQLSSRVVQAVQAIPLSMDPHKVLVAFHSGWLQGVTCTVVVAGRRVRLRMRADGARQRADLLRTREILAGRLGSAGFELSGYEVSP